MSEAWFLLGVTDVGRRSLLDLVERGAVEVSLDLGQDMPRVVELLRRYADVPMSVADACLVRMSEKFPDSVVLTLDTDFGIYRRHRRHKIPLVIPPNV